MDKVLILGIVCISLAFGAGIIFGMQETSRHLTEAYNYGFDDGYWSGRQKCLCRSEFAWFSHTWRYYESDLNITIPDKHKELVEEIEKRE